MALVVLSLFPAGCSQTENEKDALVRKIEIFEVQAGTYGQQLSLTGTIIPLETVNLAFKLAGPVDKVLYQEGEHVAMHNPVAKLATTDYQLQLEAKRAEYQAAHMRLEKEVPSKIRQAKTQLDLTKVTYDRMSAMYETRHISRAQMDEIQAKLNADRETYTQALEAEKVAATQLQMLAIALEKAENDLKDTTIYSPMDGIVLKKIVQDGEMVSAGYPVLVLGKSGQLCVSVGISEQDINRLQLGQEAWVSFYSSSEQHKARVHEISGLADATTRTFQVKLLLDSPMPDLKPGMLAKAQIPLQSRHVLLIPLSSVIKKAAGSEVFVYSPADNSVHKRSIQTGDIIRDTIQVVSGLEPGEYIVSKGQFVLAENTPVLVVKNGQGE